MAKNSREILLDYTFNEIQKYGYFQANTSVILKKCKIPKGSMYHYFSSKHDLALSVIKERVRPKTLKNYTIKVKESGYFESLLTFLEGIDFQKKAFIYGCAMHKLIVEMSHLDATFKQELDEIYQEVVAHFCDILALAITNKEIKKCDIEEKANLILTTILGAISLKNHLALQSLIKELRLLKPLKKQTKPLRQQTLF
jgi:TetR/AcrR family transcriptional repressor of nem operon